MYKTERFYLRELTEADATTSYLGWLSSEGTARYIETAGNVVNIQNLKNFIKEKLDNPNVLFLGIFSDKGQHVGNVKFEPVNLSEGYAVMGIMIGEADYRGVGVAGEVLLEMAIQLKKMGIGTMVLGVDCDNEAAIRAYRKIGFLSVEQKFLNFKNSEAAIEMHLKL